MPDYVAQTTIKLEPDPDADSFQVTIFVIDTEDGVAVNGATVNIQGQSTAYSATDTVSSGVAVFSDVLEDDYEVTVSYAGYKDSTETLPKSEFEEQ